MRINIVFAGFTTNFWLMVSPSDRIFLRVNSQSNLSLGDQLFVIVQKFINDVAFGI